MNPPREEAQCWQLITGGTVRRSIQERGVREEEIQLQGKGS